MRSKVKIPALVVAFVLLIGAAIWVIHWFPEYQARQEAQQQYQELAEKYLLEPADKGQSPIAENNKEMASVSQSEALESVPHSSELIKNKEAVKADFEALKVQNPDIVGWLFVDGAGINYPVVQAEDNQKYLRRNFYGEQSIAGTLFLDCDNSSDFSDGNSVIHGHNMFDGSSNMFSSLTKYKNYDYWAANPTILLDTPQGSMEFQIFAVCSFDVNSADAANYLRQDFRSEEAQSEYVRNLITNSLIQTGVSVPDGSRLLTLSTCDRSVYGDNGRLVVVGYLFA